MKIKFNKDTLGYNSAVALMIGSGNPLKNALPRSEDGDPLYYSGADELKLQQALYIQFKAGDTVDINYYNFSADGLSFRIFHKLNHNQICTDEYDVTPIFVEGITESDFEIIED